MKTTYHNCFRSLGLLFFAVVLMLLLFSAGGCRRWSHNGDIDGHWQITSVELLDEQGEITETLHPQDYYIAIGLELLQLYYENTVCTGRMYVNGNMLEVDFSKVSNNPVWLRENCGFMEPVDNYEIITANCDHLVLQGSHSRISGRRW